MSVKLNMPKLMTVILLMGILFLICSCYTQYPIIPITPTEGKVNKWLHVYKTNGEQYTLVWYEISNNVLSGEDKDGNYIVEKLENIRKIEITKRTKTGKAVHGTVAGLFTIIFGMICVFALYNPFGGLN